MYENPTLAATGVGILTILGFDIPVPVAIAAGSVLVIAGAFAIVGFRKRGRRDQ